MDDPTNTPQTNSNPPAEPASNTNGDGSFKVPVPKDIAQPIQKFTNNLSNAANGADGVADNLEQAMDHGLDVVEKKLDNFISGLDKFLGKF